MPTPIIAICYTSQELKSKAQTLSKSLCLPVEELGVTSYPLFLLLTPERLELHYKSKEKHNPIYVDFITGTLLHRQKYGSGKNQLIARAIGLKSYFKPEVLDLTAGLGKDAFVLATLGCTVTMVERSPIIAALVRDGLRRAQQEAWFAKLKLHLVEMQAKIYLHQLTHKPDVIYLDPMFPETKKSALVKKEMRALRLVVGKDEDAKELLELARSLAKKRVVVKRAQHAPTLSAQKPDIVYTGKSCRFDVYLA